MKKITYDTLLELLEEILDCGAFEHRCGNGLFQRIPCTAAGTAALPFGTLVAAARAVKYGFRLCHGIDLLVRF